MKYAFGVGWFLLILVALSIRVPQLERRPLHNDEAVNTVKFKGLWEDGSFQYDPDHYHGPSLFYAALPVVELGGKRPFAALREEEFRLVPVLFGVGLLVLLPLVADGLGRQATWWAGLMTTASTAMVFYSRYFIHEMLLVFFTFLFLAASWRYYRSGHWFWAVVAGMGLGLMHATKETFLFSVVAMGLAGVGAWVWAKCWGSDGEGTEATLRPWPIALGLLVSVLVSVTFFTSFFTHPAGVLDSVQTYWSWFEQSKGDSPHAHPWHYFLGLLAFKQFGTRVWWSEGLILGLASVAVLWSFAARRIPFGHLGFIRFLACYTLLLTGIYSAIPYKTPWCLLGFLHGMILLAGVGAAGLVVWARRWPLQTVVCLLLLAGVGQLGWQAWKASYPYCDSQRNPYVYAHTLSDVFELEERVEALAASQAPGHRMMIQVITQGGDVWPLPWYLRRFEQVGYYPEVPDVVAAPLLIVSPDFASAVMEKTDGQYQLAGFYGLRPSVFLQLYVQQGVWDRFLADATGE